MTVPKEVTVDLPPGIRDFLAWLRVECGAAKSTLAAYDADLRLYVTSLGDQSLLHATRDDVLTFVATEERRGMSAATQARRLVAVRTCHRWLHGEGRASDDPGAEVDGPTLWNRIPGYLTPERVEHLLAPDDEPTPRSLRDQCVMELLYSCGLRASEIAALRCDGVRRDESVVRVRGKGGKDRIVPFGSRARETVDRWEQDGRPHCVPRNGDDPPELLLSVRGKALSRQVVWTTVRARATARGIEGKLSPHSLRHSFATHLLSGGADLRVVQALLGHASVSTTQIYTRVDADRMRASHRQFHPRG